jgi:hypothetical protein
LLGVEQEEDSEEEEAHGRQRQRELFIKLHGFEDSPVSLVHHLSSLPHPPPPANNDSTTKKKRKKESGGDWRRMMRSSNDTMSVGLNNQTMSNFLSMRIRPASPSRRDESSASSPPPPPPLLVVDRCGVDCLFKEALSLYFHSL